MTTHPATDICLMAEHFDSTQAPGGNLPELHPHEPRDRRHESPEARAARIAALTRAVRNGTYDTAMHAKLGAEALCDALMSGRRRP
jgi:hypothetical protein